MPLLHMHPGCATVVLLDLRRTPWDAFITDALEASAKGLDLRTAPDRLKFRVAFKERMEGCYTADLLFHGQAAGLLLTNGSSRPRIHAMITNQFIARWEESHPLPATVVLDDAMKKRIKNVLVYGTDLPGSSVDALYSQILFALKGA